MKIKAAVLNTIGAKTPYAESRPLAIDTLDLEGPALARCWCRIGAAGLCHSDLSVIDGNRPRPTPMALGHEAAATVEEVGAGVDGLAWATTRSGLRAELRALRPCAAGRPALCEPAAAANVAGTLLSGAPAV